MIIESLFNSAKIEKGVKQSEKNQKKPTGSADQEELTDKIFGKVGDFSCHSGHHGCHSSSSFPLDRNERLFFLYWFRGVVKQLGEFATTEEVTNDPCAGMHGKQYGSPNGAGLGKY